MKNTTGHPCFTWLWMLLLFSGTWSFQLRPTTFWHQGPELRPMLLKSSTTSSPLSSEDPHVDTILFVECGFGADAHGQDPTKAAVRACRNAIEFNQIPSISQIVPGGRDEMKLDVLLAVPPKYQADLDLDPVRECFPYGKICIQIQDGGMVAQSGVMIETLGDTNEDMVIVCCAVTVGY